MATPKLAQILQLTPANEIVFEGPFENVVTSYLELNNPTEQRVCFKVKTTAPRRYCVRPNSGTVQPGSKVKIAIMLQPIEAESQSERSKHKFMVQSTVIEDEENCNLDVVWRDAPPEKIMDSKLRCVFAAPNTPAPAPTQATTTTILSSATSSEPTSTTSNQTTSTPKPTTTAAPATTTTTIQQQSQVTISEKLPLLAGDGQNASSRIKETDSTSRSTPPTSSSSLRTSTANKNWASNVSSQNMKSENSVASSHNLSTSFLQPMSDDKKMLLVSLIMLFFGVILGKYII